MNSLFLLVTVHLFVRTLVGSQSVDGGEFRRGAFKVNVRVLALVAASQSDHWPLMYLHAFFLLLRFPPDPLGPEAPVGFNEITNVDIIKKIRYNLLKMTCKPLYFSNEK